MEIDITPVTCGPWSSTGVYGVQRFLEDVWLLILKPVSAAGESDETQVRELRRKTHQTIRRVTRDIETFSFNTMVAALMEFKNTLEKASASAVVNTKAWNEAAETLLLLMAPGFPHIAEELWHRYGGQGSVHQQLWPAWDEELAAEDTITLVVQTNGKVRERLVLPVNTSEEEARERALSAPGVIKFIEGKTIVKVIVVPGKLVNIVVK